jgi:hypothetical protein
MNTNGEHFPDEQTLIDAILTGTIDVWKAHLDSCSDCNAKVQDFIALKKGLFSIENEQPPPHCARQPKTKTVAPAISWIEDISTDWYRNPFVLVFGMISTLFFLYILIVFVFK